MVEKTEVVHRDYDSVDQIPELVFRALCMLNFLILLYVALLTYHALWGYVNEGAALEFLLSAGRVPPMAWKYPVTVMMLYVSLQLLLSLECNNHPELVVKLILEFGIAIGISYMTGFGYTGMIVLLLADILRYTIDWKKRALYIVAVSVFYLFMNGNIVQSWINVVPLGKIWKYYRADHQERLLGILSMLALINMFLFIFYMVIMALAQMSEKERILILNNELKVANIKLEEYASESARMAETRERNRLAREIHDTLGHSLTGIITGIEACIMLMDVAPEATKETLPYYELESELADEVGDCDSAAAAYRKLWKIAPAETRYGAGLAIAYDRCSQKQAAINTYRKVLKDRKLDPNVRDFAERRLRVLGGKK